MTPPEEQTHLNARSIFKSPGRLKKPTAQAMESVFLETFRPRDCLVNRTAGDVDRYWPVEDCVEVGDRFGIGQLLYASFDHGKRCSVMTTMKLVDKFATDWTGTHRGAKSLRRSI